MTENTGNGRVTEQDYLAAANELGVVIVNEPIQPGDLYLAGRNVSVQLYTCKSVNPGNWIVSTDPIAYSYDTWECKLVLEIKLKKKKNTT